ncbi:MAG: hypothetical protein HY677_02245 [Chloroflexi bacterium]|nr:hypothetical protein [Chloroflexota bacterium]
MRKPALLIALALLVGILLPAPLPATADPALAGAVAGNLVSPNGANMFLIGANYVGGPDRSWTMWQDGLFDPALLEKDFLKARAAGLNSLRLFVRQPLPAEVAAGRWGKLDTVVALAEKQGINLILTLYDYREDDLAMAAAIGATIAKHYAGKGIILAYDLKNEPHYQDLAISQYPGSPPPLQTDSLIKSYGEQMSQADADAWRAGDGAAQIPARFSPHDAYIYANNYRIYLRFLKEAGDWMTARNYEGSVLDFIASPDSARWRPLLDVLNQTLAAWLKPQIDAIRSADKDHLITVGYSDPVLAGLPANNALGAVSIHRFPNVGAKALRVAFDLLNDMRAAFPDKPMLLEEFGYPNDSSDPALTALYEAATMLHLMSQGWAGGAKWSLYDLAKGWDARENSFGLYRADGSPKPIALVLGAIGEYSRMGTHPAGKLSVEAEPSGPGIRYVYSAPDAIFAAGLSYADPGGRLSFEAAESTQVFVFWPKGNVISIAATGPARVRLNLAALLGFKSAGDLALQKTDGAAIPFEKQGESISFSPEGGQIYQLRIGSRAVNPRIEIVWPQDGKPVAEAKLANISGYLFYNGKGAVICQDQSPNVRLWRALNNGVEEEVAVGKRRSVSAQGLAFSAWDFDGVDVSAARDPRNKYYFRLSVDGLPGHGNIWSHGDDARTYLPAPDVPAGIAPAAPQQVDGRIEIVWPHDNLPVDKATKANVSTYLFQRGTLQSVPADWSPTVRLWRALNSGQEEEVAVGRKVMKKAGDVSFPAWEFDNIDVSAAANPVNKYYFRVTVDGIDSHSNIWSHGADARTYFPNKDVPTGVAECR